MGFTDSSWVRVEALINGSWVDLTADADDVDNGGRISGTKGVTLKHGRSLGAQRANSRTADFDIYNRDGKYVSRNPRSPYWGQLPLNTPCRVTALPYESHVAFHSDNESLFTVPLSAPDSATLDITGDLEFWIDLEPEQNNDAYAYTVVNKWQGPSQYSWIFILYLGRPLLYWTPDGTFTNARVLLLNESVPNGRISLKIQLDVNNGAGGTTLTAYSATSIDGTYTLVGSATSAGTTSLFSSTANLTFSSDHNGTVGVRYPISEKFQGKLYEFRLYSGIGGSLRATANFKNLQPGATSVSDGTTIWTIASPAYVASDKIRFYGYIPRWPVAVADKVNIYSTIKAHGLFNVLNQGARDLDSPMYRFYSTVSSLIGYWPCEDGTDSSQISAGNTVTSPAVTQNIQFAAQSDLPGSKALPTLGTDSLIRGRFRNYTSTGSWAFAFCIYLDAVPAVDVPMMYITTSNGMVVKFQVGTTTYLTQIYDANGTLLSTANTLYGTGAEPGQWLAFVYEFTQSGGNVDWALNWRGVPTNIAYAHSGSYAGTLGKLSSWYVTGVPSGASVNTVSVGQVAGDSTIDVFLESPHIRSFRGYVGETDIDRLERLCGEEGINFIVKGVPTDGVEMGKQDVKTLVGLFDDCAAAGRGVLIETRFSDALMYITRRELQHYYTRDIPLTAGDGELLNAEIDPDIEPVNYVTVTRDSGGSSTAITTTGPRAVSLIGTFGDPQTLNLYTDDQTSDTAEWIRHIGSWDEDRWFNLQLELAKPAIQDDPQMLAAVLGFDLLRGIRLTNMPSYLTVREAECLIEEYTEVLQRRTYGMSINTSPARPYAVAQWRDNRVRIGSSESRVSTAIDDSTTSLVVKSSSPYTAWRYSSNFYISVDNDREKMLVTGISGTASPWTFTVSRGTPAFSHAVDVTVRLWDSRVIGY